LGQNEKIHKFQEKGFLEKVKENFPKRSALGVEMGKKALDGNNFKAKQSLIVAPCFWTWLNAQKKDGFFPCRAKSAKPMPYTPIKFSWLPPKVKTEDVVKGFLDFGGMIILRKPFKHGRSLNRSGSSPNWIDFGFEQNQSDWNCRKLAIIPFHPNQAITHVRKEVSTMTANVRLPCFKILVEHANEVDRYAKFNFLNSDSWVSDDFFQRPAAWCPLLPKPSPKKNFRVDSSNPATKYSWIWIQIGLLNNKVLAMPRN